LYNLWGHRTYSSGLAAHWVIAQKTVVNLHIDNTILPHLSLFVCFASSHIKVTWSCIQDTQVPTRPNLTPKSTPPLWRIVVVSSTRKTPAARSVSSGESNLVNLHYQSHTVAITISRLLFKIAIQDCYSRLKLQLVTGLYFNLEKQSSGTMQS
jgi:hypothetical protein